MSAARPPEGAKAPSGGSDRHEVRERGGVAFDPPLIAILRGVRPAEVVEVGEVLLACGLRVIEVPLNSPEPFESIALLARTFGERATIGAGTVLTAADVDRSADAGARLVLAPNFDAAVVRQARLRGLYAMPGVATATEGFAALAAGADALKLFPGEQLGPPVIKAWRAVFPRSVPFYSVGGVGPANLRACLEAGATGAGIGSSLYTPGIALDQLADRARALVAKWNDYAASRTTP